MPLPPEAAPVAESTELLGWLLGQSAALVVAMLWVVSLLRQLRAAATREAATRSELMASLERNTLLSDWLCRTVESGSLERSKLRDQHLFRLDSTMRSIAGLLTRVLESLTTLPVKSPLPSKPETTRF